MADVRLLWSWWQSLLVQFSSAFTRPGWVRFVQWVTGTVLCWEEDTITQILVSLALESRWRPYHAAYLNFRWLMESGGGVIRDRGAHMFSVIRWCLDADDQAPVSVEATGSPPGPGIFDCPPRMKVVYTFKDPDWEVIWEQPGEAPEGNPGGFGIVFYGERGRLVVHRDGTRIPAAERVRKFKVPPGGVHVERVAKHDDYNMNHKEDFFQAIRTGIRITSKWPRLPLGGPPVGNALRGVGGAFGGGFTKSDCRC